MIKHFATLKGARRINNSVNGNPNYIVTLDKGDGINIELRSSSDSSWCYAYTNQWVGKTVTYTTTRSGRIDTLALTTLHDTFTDKILMGA